MIVLPKKIQQKKYDPNQCPEFPTDLILDHVSFAFHPASGGAFTHFLARSPIAIW